MHKPERKWQDYKPVPSIDPIETMKAQGDRVKVLEAAIQAEVNYSEYIEDAIDVEKEEYSAQRDEGERFFKSNRVALLKAKENEKLIEEQRK